MAGPSRAGVTGTYVQTVAFGSPMLATQGQGSAWFGPNAPMAPQAPADVVGRQFDYQPGFNLNTRPRAYTPIGFGELRGLADGYDLLRLAIETRKDQVSRMSWSIKGRKAQAKDNDDPRVEALTSFFERPDGVNGWSDWLRPIMEDMFVIDAPTLYMERARSGQLLNLKQLDGATIKPVIDDWGRTPQPFSQGGTVTWPVAYQQVLKGFPAVDYSVRNLLYRPRNRRVHTPYGFSPVEQIVTTVNIALRRQLFTLSYFTEGSVPDSMISVPEAWTPDQIATYQTAWDIYLTGDAAARRKVKFIPGGTGKTVHETKTPDLKGDFDEWLAKLVCFAFSISPQALTRQMNRASADTQKELAEEEGLEPILLWLKAWLDDIIAIEFNAPDLEFAWSNDDQVDQAQQLEILTGYVSKGIMTINESRDRLGLDPLPDPEASQAMIITATGAVPLSSFSQAQQQAEEQRQATAEAAARITAQPAALPAPHEHTQVAPAPTKSFSKRQAARVRRPEPIPFDRPATRRAQQKIAGQLKTVFAALAKQAEGLLRSRVGKVAKAAPDDPEDAPEDRARREADEIFDAFDLSDLQDLAAEFGDDLEDVVTDMVAKAVAQVGVDTASDLVDQVNERAVAIARDRAAELVGMKYDDAGNLVSSDDPDMAITDTTRDMLRQTIADGLADNIGLDEIADSIADSYGFSADRADTIAETEVARANGMAATESYRSARDDAGVNVRKEWLAEADCCDVCSDNADAGPIDLDDDFPSGDDAPPGHPSCRCAVSPVVLDDENDDQDDLSD